MSFLRLPLVKRKRRQYDPTLIAAAYNDVLNSGMSVYKSARLHGVPESTLRDRHLRNQPCDVAQPTVIPIPGSAPTLSRDEENKLVDHVTYMANIGYGYSRQAFMRLATDYAISAGKKSESDPPFRQSWYNSFNKRWPNIHLAKPEKLAMVRAKATSEEVLNKYYDELDRVLEQNNLSDKPERIWNVDETGLSLEHTPPKVVCSKENTPQAVTSSRGKNITIISGGNAAGNHIPPYYIFPGKRWYPELLEDTCPGTNGEVTESGWSNTDSFMNFLDRHFKRFVPRQEGRKDIIIVDGHKSHVNLTLTDWGQKNGVIFFVLPPHTSHVTQPLDVGCFAPLKSVYNNECQNYMRQNPGQQINRYRVGKLSSTAYLKALSAENLISSFRKTGIYPLNKAVDAVKVMPARIYSETDDDAPTAPATDFLESRKIVRASTGTAKKVTKPSITGDLSSKECQQRLNAITSSTGQSAKKNKAPTTQKKGKALTKKRGRPSTRPVLPESPQPGPSGVNRVLENEDSQSSCDEIDASELCCVCRKFMPEDINLWYQLEIAQWGECDKCKHWTHLKYCSKIRVLRRGDDFLCPHCDISTARP